MTIKIKKISSFALLSTVIGASATAPAHAISSQGTTPDSGVEADNQKTYLENQQSTNNIGFCISEPEFDSSCKNSFLQDARETMEIIKTAEATQKMEQAWQEQTKNAYEQNLNIAISRTVATNQGDISYSNTYVDIEKQFAKVKKKVPEPSVMLGLVSFCLLAAKCKATKNLKRDKRE